MKTVFKNKMVHFLLCTVMCVSVLTSCSNELVKQDVDNATMPQRRLPQVSLDYGEMHNNLLDECLALCEEINPLDYVVETIDDENFYSLYATYSDVILQTTHNAIYVLYGVDFNFGGITSISSPSEYTALQNQLNLYEQECPGMDSALHSVENLFAYYAEQIPNETGFVENYYWLELSANIDEYAEDIYATCEPLCQSEEEREGLEVMLSVLIGSFNYWSQSENMEAWGELAWNANCHYLNINNMEETEFENFHANYTLSNREKIFAFVMADYEGAKIGCGIGACFAGVGAGYGALAVGSICSGLVALSWD